MFETIYDIINYIERKCPHYLLNIYGSDSFFTAYRMHLHIWVKYINIPVKNILIINSNLKQGSINIWNDTVYLSY